MTIDDLAVFDFHRWNIPYRSTYMLVGQGNYCLHVDTNDEGRVIEFALIGGTRVCDWTKLHGDENDTQILIDVLSELEYPPANAMKRNQLITEYLDENP